MKAPVIEKKLQDANAVARLNRLTLREAAVFTISISGGPGCGKTSLIDTTIDRLVPEYRAGVVACDVASHQDADRISRHTEQVVQVNTGQCGASDATDVHDALQWLDLQWIDVLFIENVGTLIGPVASELGQDVTAAVFSVAAGHDKADKHPELVQAADVVVLNKIDLIPAVRFESAAFRQDVRRLNPSAELFELSALDDQGTDRWIKWLKARVNRFQQTASNCYG